MTKRERLTAVVVGVVAVAVAAGAVRLLAHPPAGRAPAVVPPGRPRGADHPVAAAQAAAAVFTIGPAADIRKQGATLRDKDGRYVLLRGVNLASRSKRPPYLPVLPVATTRLDAGQVAAELERLDPELGRLQNAGVNVVRLLVMWKAVEPAPHHDTAALDPSAAAYLSALRQVVDALYRHGMLVVIDFHQDIASEVYGGDGFPDWAVAIDARHPRPRGSPAPDLWWGVRYYDVSGSRLSKGVRHTLQSFWQGALTNTEGGLAADDVQAPLVRSIGFTAAFFADHPGVLGYEPFNEPAQVGLPKERFEREILGSFYARVAAEVAQRHPRAFVFAEPRLDWTTYPAEAAEPSVLRPWSLVAFTDHPRTFLDLERAAREAPVVFSFHYYDPWLIASVPFRHDMAARARAWPALFAEMAAAAREQGAVPFLTEFGCDQNWTMPSDLEPAVYGTVARACIDHQYRAVEANLLHATYWNYDFYSRRRPDGGADENWNEENLSLLGPEGPQNLDLAARPYPMRSSARLERVWFDFASRHAAIVLSGVPVSAPTVVFVPHRVHYAGVGFEVRATGSRPIEFDGERGLLSWWPDGDAGPHLLVLSPAGGFDAQVLPPEARAHLGRLRRWTFRTDSSAVGSTVKR